MQPGVYDDPRQSKYCTSLRHSFGHKREIATETTHVNGHHRIADGVDDQTRQDSIHGKAIETFDRDNAAEESKKRGQNAYPDPPNDVQVFLKDQFCEGAAIVGFSDECLVKDWPYPVAL